MSIRSMTSWTPPEGGSGGGQIPSERKALRCTAKKLGALIWNSMFHGTIAPPLYFDRPLCAHRPSAAIRNHTITNLKTFTENPQLGPLLKVPSAPYLHVHRRRLQWVAEHAMKTFFLIVFLGVSTLG